MLQELEIEQVSVCIYETMKSVSRGPDRWENAVFWGFSIPLNQRPEPLS